MQGACQQLIHQIFAQCPLCPRHRAWHSLPLREHDEGSGEWRETAPGRAAEAGSGGLLCRSQEFQLPFTGDRESLEQFKLTLWNELLQKDFVFYGSKRGHDLPVSIRVKKEMASQHKEIRYFPLMTSFSASLNKCLLQIFQGPGQ